jgi:hypothetical protein
MLPFVGAIALFVVLGLLVLGERAFERGRRRRRAPKQLPPPRG